MTRLEELTLKLADDALADAESHELEALTTESEPAAAHTLLLELEAALRGQRETLELAGPTLTRLRSELGVSVARGVMQRLETEPPPSWVRPRITAPAETRGNKRRRFEVFPERWLPPRPSWTAVLALAASVLFFVGLGVWFFSPTMGQPVLAELKGADASIERGTEFIPAAKGMALQPADVLRLGTNATATITFGAEQTRFDLSTGTELKRTSLARGKRFLLQEGRIEASVARQRPFHPMILVTPQAEAKVLGTRFSLGTIDDSTRLEVTEGTVRLTRLSDGVSTNVSAGHYAVVATNTVLAPLPFTGSLYREYWTNLVGGSWTYLITHTNYPDRPDGREYLTNLTRLEMPSNLGDNYGERLRGYVHPPKTGEYTFWIAAKDDGSLYLSPDENPENKVHMAHSKGAAPSDWQDDPAQQSGSVPLIAGKRYYFEVLHKAAVGDDSLAVAWQGPGQKRQVIAGEFLSPFKSKEK